MRLSQDMNTGYLIFSPSKPYSASAFNVIQNIIVAHIFSPSEPYLAYTFNVIQNIIVAHIFSPSEPYSAYTFNVTQNIIVAHRVKVQINHGSKLRLIFLRKAVFRSVL